jgi:hypothetical protein
MRKEIITRGVGIALRLGTAYLAGRAVILGQEHERRSQEARDRAVARRLRNHPSRVGLPKETPSRFEAGR